MSQLGVEGLRAERDALLEVFKSLSDDEWNAPSDCAGWTVRDVAAHLAASSHGVVDPAYLADMSNGTEQAMEGPVAERRSWPIADVIAEYETYSAQLADVTESMQQPPLADNLLPMNDLGTHPMSILSNVFLFDTYCHLRNDILHPNGPIDRPEPPRDERRLRPTLEWMLAGIPWMAKDPLNKVLDDPIVLVLEGDGGGTWTLAPGDGTSDGRPIVAEGATESARATVRSSAHDFVIWATQRRPWRDYVKLDGDADYAARVLDVINVI
jgi:uncharacterized protein (TIGR03083 family)